MGRGKKSCPLCGTNPSAGEQVCPTKGSLVDIKEEASPEKEKNKDLVLLKRLGRLLNIGEIWKVLKKYLKSMDSPIVVCLLRPPQALSQPAKLFAKFSTFFEV